MIDCTAGTIDAVCAHAQAEYPREACGLIIVARGRQMYRRCRNISTDGGQFVMAKEDYAAAEDEGDIVAVVHSHPDAPAIASQHDRVECEQSGLPWIILSVRETSDGSLDCSEWGAIEPCGWRPPLVGRQFVHGSVDCYSLIRDWYRIERGIDLPDFDRPDDWWLNGLDLYESGFPSAGFQALPDGSAPRIGDVFLAQIRSPVPNHAGVYIGDGMVLHHLHGRLSSRDIWGGYLAENCRRWLRHGDVIDA